MTRVTLVCPTCGHTARRGLMLEVACRGTHETISEPARCPKGHGLLVRKDGVQNTSPIPARVDPRNTRSC